MILGPGSTDYLIDLWITVAEDRPDGILSDWDEIDIALAAGWEGEPETLVSALLDSKWLDKSDDGYYHLHDWHDHQGWACGATERQEKARVNALIKHHGRQRGLEIARDKHGIDIRSYGYDLKSATSMLPADTQQDCSTATSMLPADLQHATGMLRQHAPSPSPSPSPKDKNASSEAPPAPVSKKTVKKNKHFSKQLSEFSDIYKNIKSLCRQLERLPPRSGRRFNPYQWVQVKANQRGHPGAIDQCLKQLLDYWDGIETPWGYAESTFLTVNGNWNERDAIKLHEELKLRTTEDLSGITHGLLNSI